MAQQPQSMGGQASTSTGDIATQLLSIVRQLSANYTSMQSLIAALQAVNFPQNVKGYTVATLPSSPAIGHLTYVTDGASALAWGATVSGGGTSTYLTWWNGANWSVVGK